MVNFNSKQSVLLHCLCLPLFCPPPLWSSSSSEFFIVRHIHLQVLTLLWWFNNSVFSDSAIDLKRQFVLCFSSITLEVSLLVCDKLISNICINARTYDSDISIVEFCEVIRIAVKLLSGLAFWPFDACFSLVSTISRLILSFPLLFIWFI